MTKQKAKKPLVIYDQCIDYELLIVNCHINGDIKILDCYIDKDIKISRSVVGGDIAESRNLFNVQPGRKLPGGKNDRRNPKNPRFTKW